SLARALQPSLELAGQNNPPPARLSSDPHTLRYHSYVVNTFFTYARVSGNGMSSASSTLPDQDSSLSHLNTLARPPLYAASAKAVSLSNSRRKFARYQTPIDTLISGSKSISSE